MKILYSKKVFFIYNLYLKIDDYILIEASNNFRLMRHET